MERLFAVFEDYFTRPATRRGDDDGAAAAARRGAAAAPRRGGDKRLEGIEAR